MGVTWGASSRLTLKRQKTRQQSREKGRPRVSSLGQIIRVIERDAAALPTGELRDEIEVSLGVLDATISQFYRARPGIRGVDERISATGNVMIATLTVALYVRELATRSADVTAVVTSLN
jgi:hypothetical protein